MFLEISKDECELLISLLTSAIADTKEEIYKTEQHDFKVELKNEKAIMESILTRLLKYSMDDTRPYESIH